MTKEIDSFPNYTISTTGVITNTKTNYTKQQWLCQNGYYYVDLQHKGYKRKYPVHRLLALAFLPNPLNKRTVNHKDGNKENNDLSNLEWATDSENMQHAYDHNLNYTTRKLTAAEADSYFLNDIMKGSTITALSKKLNVGLTQLSYRMKEASKRLNLEKEYAEELRQQKLTRQSKSAS